ncbi:protein At-4/1-like [Nicotiana tabacum]|uniref:4/1 protein n=1 Tax=Nicotiana tabacum TaxID=4097 RepID=A9QLK4_TOBAC|nr:protein At-4/1-like [Nicotiana tabacum]ABV69696.1 4/1 protein [Nicotiana tabacum]
MAATTDEAMESLLSSFDQIYDEFKNGAVEIQTLQADYITGSTKREALEFTVQRLQSENDRLRKLYAESLNTLAYKIESHSSCQSLKEDLKGVHHEFLQKENEYIRTIESLKGDHAERIQELESQIRRYQTEDAVNKATINQLRHDLVVHRSQMEALKRNLDQVSAEVDSRYHYEIQGLKDSLLVEQEEKNELNKRLRDMEKELFISRTKLVEYQQDSTSSQHMHTLKQKIMKLRKENEVLKRQIHERKEF